MLEGPCRPNKICDCDSFQDKNIVAHTFFLDPITPYPRLFPVPVSPFFPPPPTPPRARPNPPSTHLHLANLVIQYLSSYSFGLKTNSPSSWPHLPALTMESLVAFPNPMLDTHSYRPLCIDSHRPSPPSFVFPRSGPAHPRTHFLSQPVPGEPSSP